MRWPKLPVRQQLPSIHEALRLEGHHVGSQEDLNTATSVDNVKPESVDGRPLLFNYLQVSLPPE